MNSEELKKKILATQDLKTEKVKVPEWDCEITLRELTGIERDRIESLTGTSELGIRTLVLSMAICDEKLNRIFITPADMEALGKKNGNVLTRLFERAWSLCGMGVTGIEQAGNDSEPSHKED